MRCSTSTERRHGRNPKNNPGIRCRYRCSMGPGTLWHPRERRSRQSSKKCNKTGRTTSPSFIQQCLFSYQKMCERQTTEAERTSNNLRKYEPAEGAGGREQERPSRPRPTAIRLPPSLNDLPTHSERRSQPNVPTMRRSGRHHPTLVDRVPSHRRGKDAPLWNSGVGLGHLDKRTKEIHCAGTENNSLWRIYSVGPL